MTTFIFIRRGDDSILSNLILMR